MPSSESDRFAPTVPPRSEPYTLKGSAGLDWGMQSRLARVFRPATNRTVMLAVDHGYFQGPTTGLERDRGRCLERAARHRRLARAA